MTSVIEITEREGVLVGPIRNSRNAARDAKGSIHDDATAQKLGLRGGTVAGSVHLNLFPPVLLRAFGQAWFDRGSLSINFRNPTVDKEGVRAFVTCPPASAASAQVDAWVEREDGMRVGEGTAAVGDPTETTALRSLDLTRFEPGELSILAGVEVGETIPPVEVATGPDRQQQFIERGLITEIMEWNTGDSPWGGPVVVPQFAVQHLYQPGAAHLGRRVRDNGGGVGLFGAIELANLDGPLLIGETYTVAGKVLALGQSPRTEYAWFETTATREGKPVASMMMQLRWMKGSNPKYTE